MSREEGRAGEGSRPKVGRKKTGVTGKSVCSAEKTVRALSYSSGRQESPPDTGTEGHRLSAGSLAVDAGGSDDLGTPQVPLFRVFFR